MTVFFGLLLAKAEFEIARIIANRAGWKSGSVIEKSRPNIERFKNTAMCGEGGGRKQVYLSITSRAR